MTAKNPQKSDDDTRVKQPRGAESSGVGFREDRTVRALVRYGALFFALGLVAFGCLFPLIAGKNALLEYRVFIENEYKPALSLIETSMKTVEEDYYEKPGGSEAYEEMKNKIEQALAGPEFDYAWWSRDGHHGHETLKLGDTQSGWCRYRIVSSADAEKRHFLYFGGSEDGTKFLVYVGWVESEWKRHYCIVFRRDLVRAEMGE